MPKGPIRRGQLIAPFGVGAMIVVRDGTSLICCGLDHWFQREDLAQDSQSTDTDEYVIDEWRLQKLLRLDSLRMPPDYRKKRFQDNSRNLFMTVPFLRFPQYHFCPRCKKLQIVLLTRRDKEQCDDCQAEGKRIFLVQVPFVAMCDHGHLQDFPWREWVHRTSEPSCNQVIRLKATGGSTLASQTVTCECGVKSRTLARITEASADETRTFLSDNLNESKAPYFCRGKKPWLGIGIHEKGDDCNRPLRGSLRSASNLYYAHIQSSIYIPRSDESVPSDLIELLEQPPLSTLIHLLEGAGKKDIKPQDLRSIHRSLLQSFTDDEIAGGLKTILDEKNTDSSKESFINEDESTAFRRTEFNVLRLPRTEDQLFIRMSELSAYKEIVSVNFSRITLVEKLRETRTMAGFARVFPEDGRTLQDRKALLWRNPPRSVLTDWLPAYKVFGEGIFFELNAAKLRKWESKKEVIERAAKLGANFYKLKTSKHLIEKPISPRFILLHTLSHLIINQMTFECGYSSASLRERLYVSNDPKSPMAGILVYTAAGDADGSMGGLVRMGKPGYLEPILDIALNNARWCSADPVCMEMGASGGQGPDSCNLAACHNCALVPETACEEFNRFLDRGLVVGETKQPEIAYFT